MRFRLFAAVAAAAAGCSLAMAGHASAGDVQGDAYSCEELWVMRNQIYKDRGYCFKTERAITYFGIGGCLHDSEDSLPLLKSERRLVRDIEASEGRQGC